MILYTDNKEKDFKFSLSYYPSTSYIVMQVDGYMEGKSFRDNTLKMLNYLKRFTISKVLVDIKNLKFISSNDCEWLEQEFLPYATSEYFKAVSFIKPNSLHACNCIENVMYQIPEGKLKGAWFEDFNKAQNWIEEQ